MARKDLESIGEKFLVDRLYDCDVRILADSVAAEDFRC